MAKHSGTFEHTADIGIEAWGDSIGELFEALAEGLSGVICDRGLVRPQQSRPIEVEAEDAEALAVDFLSAVMNLMQADHFLVATVQAKQASPTAIRAEVLGEPYDPRRHEVKTEVKAVTYHMLRVAHEGARWVGRVVLDL